ncbi:hypothetical protein [Paraburkholderia adhaesiva]|uniref:hypothetical protein n=1 Tax=Paraburkholderia adhaesiva TaxID=2883244 RepID=UPI001F3FFC50|nr:hypothetical protein [Paraburkholderia adhaesiva]
MHISRRYPHRTPGATSYEEETAATALYEALRHLAEFCATHDPARVAAAFDPQERVALHRFISTSGAWLRDFAARLPA